MRSKRRRPRTSSHLSSNGSSSSSSSSSSFTWILMSGGLCCLILFIFTNVVSYVHLNWVSSQANNMLVLDKDLAEVRSQLKIEKKRWKLLRTKLKHNPLPQVINAISNHNDVSSSLVGELNNLQQVLSSVDGDDNTVDDNTSPPVNMIIPIPTETFIEKQPQLTNTPSPSANTMIRRTNNNNSNDDGDDDDNNTKKSSNGGGANLVDLKSLLASITPSPTPPSPQYSQYNQQIPRNNNMPHPKVPPVGKGVNEMKRGSVPDGTAVLVMAHSRPQSLSKTLESIFQHQPDEGFPVFVSQDGSMSGVTQVVRTWQQQHQLYYIQFLFEETYYQMVPPEIYRPYQQVYFRIAAHYQWALTQMFDVLGYEKVIIVEDDMMIAPDFFEYFEATSKLLDVDPSLLCVSAWNDNGMSEYVTDSVQLYRTDCFPGLGWMMTMKLWKELKVKWPWGYWDDWLRLPENRKGRSCIYPEMNRVYTFGEDGASAGQFFDQLAKVKLTEQGTGFRHQNLSYLLKPHYYDYMKKLMSNPVETHALNALNTLMKLPKGEGNVYSQPIVIRYRNLGELDSILNNLRLMTDHKSGIPRTSYLLTIHFRYGQTPSVRFDTTQWNDILGSDMTTHRKNERKSADGGKPRFENGYRVFLAAAKDHQMILDEWMRKETLL